jgi:hypothetical protein
MEAWFDSSDGAHFVVYGGNQPEVFYKSKGGVLASVGTVGETGITGARLLETSAGVHLVMTDNQSRLLLKSTVGKPAAGPIDWSVLPTKVLQVPSGLGSLTLYPESRMYQALVPPALNIAVNGYSAQGQIHHLLISP